MKSFKNIFGRKGQKKIVFYFQFYICKFVFIILENILRNSKCKKMLQIIFIVTVLLQIFKFENLQSLIDVNFLII